jgi:hypothetical protein
MPSLTPGFLVPIVRKPLEAKNITIHGGWNFRWRKAAAVLE